MQKKTDRAICAAPCVLANAGILEGKHVTHIPSTENRLGNFAYEGEIVVEHL
ncbi:MAG TPA: hypothetical protein DCP92_10880 [Nitrospiraceae bacterium]|nr:hypothetical protein [Nitrospiraceae bacterium]